MYTDVCFTNRSRQPDEKVGLAFFQRQTASIPDASRIFRLLEKCPPGWSNTIRVPWDLSCRLVSANGNESEKRQLPTVFHELSKKTVLFKHGAFTLQQRYGNGCQQIELVQVKGQHFSAVRLYRGDFLISEQPFITNLVCFQVDTTIGLQHYFDGSAGDELPSAAPAIQFDFTALKSVDLLFDAQASPALSIVNVRRW